MEQQSDPTAAATQARPQPQRLIIVSNRLPYRIEVAEDGEPAFSRSVGGLVTGLSPLHEQAGNLWIGWADVDAGLTLHERLEVGLAERACVPVYLGPAEAQAYYEGFSNSTLWPLFHGFPQHTRFEQPCWEAYVQVNRRFCEAVRAAAQPGDVIWVQDYHLMLLPKMLRDALPDAQVGFFLHIPFPDFETFRMLPWRAELMQGVLGADLIGFHSYDYVRHFLSSCRRVAGIENAKGRMTVDGRVVQTDAFPLGIDYARFRRAAESSAAQDIRTLFQMSSVREGCKIMLSVERLDYSKGIPERLHAFDAFLDGHPEWKEHVVLVLVTVPSRENVASYQALKEQVDALVGLVNGKHATLSWTPVEYYYRSLPFESLVALYAASDVMLVTPLRDGMNLVCKEYLACHDGREGVLVLSEMAGAASELHEALCVNPYDERGLVDTMERALEMPAHEQRRRNAPMQRRLARYTSKKWAREFLDALALVKGRQREMQAHLIGPATARSLTGAFAGAQRRALLLDYDGTLVPFAAEPDGAAPDGRLMELLGRIGAQAGTALVIVSGRDQRTLGAWLGDLPADLVAEHGAWLRDRRTGTWELAQAVDTSWKGAVLPILSDFVDRTPGSLLEEKDCSLVWHYRMCGQELAERRVVEVRDALAGLLGSGDVAITEGNKVIEVRPRGIGKGQAAQRWFGDAGYDFLLAAGDDRTDEDLFAAAPEDAWTIKVGEGPTGARYALKSPREMRGLLEALAEA